jgi:hypothetical protein
MLRVSDCGSLPPDQLIVIAFEGQGSGRGAIGARPIQSGELTRQSISGSILQKHAKWLHVPLSNQFGLGAPASDIDETADGREDLAESIGPLPCDGECANPAAAKSGDAASLGVVGDPHRFADLRNSKQELCVLWA